MAEGKGGTGHLEREVTAALGEPPSHPPTTPGFWLLLRLPPFWVRLFEGCILEGGAQGQPHPQRNDWTPSGPQCGLPPREAVLGGGTQPWLCVCVCVCVYETEIVCMLRESVFVVCVFAVCPCVCERDCECVTKREEEGPYVYFLWKTDVSSSG